MSIALRFGALARAVFIVLVWSLPAGAAELIMLEQPGCVWCKRWNEEIGVAYPKTEEGRRAPLRRVDITDTWPEDLSGIARERLTPTFVLIENGVEIDRLRGYPGEHFFWPLLAGMLEKLPEKIN
ncbi:transcriptional regulator [Labrenzia sp. OB1]|uniref:transcriptional regulator n=1 Tax=Labrenzia sp. OB1 TaxID=1561204 RepID=UPI0007B18CAA|nr:transcriptional regulator [Labrenzia sp. OB1]KZM48725.1 regulatory protein SoxS [Labrenzia sp. OB1]